MPTPEEIVRPAGGLCPNCNAPLYGPFCYACGQSKRGLIRHFSSIIGDFLDSVLQIDSRTLRTIGPLYFKPGHLTNEYFAGRRVRYVTPLRLYFFLSIVAFLVISLVTRFDVRADGNGLSIGYQLDAEELAALSPEERAKRLEALETALRFLPEAERVKARAEIAREIEEAAKAQAAAQREGEKAERDGAAVEKARADAERDEPQLSFNGKRWHPVDNPLRFEWMSDAMNQALNEEIGVLVKKVRTIEDDPGPFVRQAFSVAPQALFLILPLFALLLKVFYLFKRRLYMEHLIVALHSHSFICLSLLVAVALVKLQAWTADWPILPNVFGFAFVLGWIWLPLYLLVMQRRVYRQNWFMTLLKYFLIGICYVVLMAFAMVFTMLVSLVLL